MHLGAVPSFLVRLERTGSSLGWGERAPASTPSWAFAAHIPVLLDEDVSLPPELEEEASAEAGQPSEAGTAHEEAGIAQQLESAGEWDFSEEEVAAAAARFLVQLERAEAEQAAPSSALSSNEVPSSELLAPPPQNFEQLFREYERYVASIGNRILGANNGVEDLVQEVFLVIYQEFHKLRDVGSVKGWLATITTRIAWRQLGRPWLYSKLSMAQMEELSPMESPDASPETKADLAALIRRLNSLPSSLRKPWVLRFIDGETLPRIAELCHCSQSTVQRRLREAGEVMLMPRVLRRGQLPEAYASAVHSSAVHSASIELARSEG